MSTIDPLSQSAQSGAGSASSRNALGQKEFLRLMIAQLQNQDPLKPLEPTEFVSQLAQFGAVTGIQEMQGAIGTLSDSMRSAQLLEGAALVGRDALVAHDAIALGETGGASGSVDFPPDANKVEVEIRNASGELVRRLTLTDGDGLTAFAWDGQTGQGLRAPPGQYSIGATAHIGGTSFALQPYIATRVDSVSIDPNGRGLTLDTSRLGELPLSRVRRIM